MGFMIVADATHGNITSIPPEIKARAGYVTGSGDVPWTQADWEANPDAIRIDQTPANTLWDATADIDDMEDGAVTLAELAPRAKLRMSSFANGTRPGQRMPLVYASASRITDVVNALIRGGVTSGVGLHVANWSMTEAAAIASVMTASGPFPIRAIQYVNMGTYDLSVVDTAWFLNRSGQKAAGGSLPAPPGSWQDAVLVGTGTDGKLWSATYDPANRRWLGTIRL